MRLTITAFLALGAFTPLAHAAPTDAQKCESALELSSARYAQCRLNAESKDTKTPDPVKLEAARAKCSQKLSDAFAKATDKYGAACAATEPSSAFDAFLAQCSDEATAAAGGAGLPDHAGELASCNADLATCEGDLAACEALPPARLLRTGQTTSYGAGSDGDLEVGIAQGYVDNGDGTITDTSTGLMWEKKSDDGTIHDKDNVYTWSGPSFGSTNVLDGTAATSFLAALNGGGGFAGYNDWRLPNQSELYSLVNLQNLNPAISAAFNGNCGANSIGNPGCTVTTCSCTVLAGNYWSSSTRPSNALWPNNPQYAWGVGFTEGSTFVQFKYLNYYVRAVRGGS
jgi:Protein of unknown function (DUF1566)